jgi:hypothetical protein
MDYLSNLLAEPELSIPDGECKVPQVWVNLIPDMTPVLCHDETILVKGGKLKGVYVSDTYVPVLEAEMVYAESIMESQDFVDALLTYGSNRTDAVLVLDLHNTIRPTRDMFESEVVHIERPVVLFVHD